MPLEIASWLFHKAAPKLQQNLTRSMTMPRTTTINSPTSQSQNGRGVPYLTFDAAVTGNSAFQRLTNEQVDELGGVEYRALTMLLYVVAGVRSA